MRNHYVDWLKTWPAQSLTILAKAYSEGAAAAAATALSPADDVYLTVLRDELAHLLAQFDASAAAREKLALLQAAIHEVCQRYGAAKVVSTAIH
jgi:hypothetical protein